MSANDPSRSKHSGNTSREEAQLDRAIERADALLFKSLKGDERRRRRNSVLFIMGGAIMVAGICTMAAVLLTAFPQNAAQGNAAPAAGAAEQDLLTTAVAAANDPVRAAQLSQEGWQAWQRQQYEPAIAKFNEAVQLDPKNTGAWNGLGWASFNSGKFAPAAEAFKKCVEIDPRHGAALNGLGQIALAERKYDEAEKYLKKAAAVPEASAAWYGLARIYLLQGKYDEAATWARKVVGSGDEDGSGQRMLAAAKAKKVPDDLRQMLEPPARGNDLARGWQLLNSGRRDEAKGVFESILAQKSDDAAALNGMGWLYFFGGDAKAARPYFEKALAAEPLAGGAMNGLARSLKAEGDLDGAIKIWQQMVDKVPPPHDGPMFLADAYMEKEEYGKAVPFLEKLAAAEPTNKQLQDKLGRARELAKAK
ncbi:MAG TPA: tetratricopeptide repeat protein [Pirellulales bacterium]|nr:tetratricopeptide repeat protein [Pirellulales bacterium]